MGGSGSGRNASEEGARCVLHIRIAEDEKERIRRAADANDEGLSALVRRLALKEADRLERRGII